jgi:prepilin-type processing-associated H-X9-DG protein
MRSTVVYVVVVVLCALFALGAVALPPQHLVAQSDGAGEAYTGDYRAGTGEYVGQVSIAFADGHAYVGELLAGRFNGPGTYQGGVKTDANGQSTHSWQVSGTFVNGQLEGQGSYSDKLGSYTGGFVDSVPSGQGTYKSNDGWSYSGAIKDGAITGYGTITYSFGKTVTGQFQNGVLVK